MSRANSTRIDISRRKRPRQIDEFNLKEKIAYSWRIGLKSKAYTSFVPYLTVFKNDLYLSFNV